MWCSTCQQDVPGLGSPSGGDFRCGKCGTDFPAANVIEPESFNGEPTATALGATAGLSSSALPGSTNKTVKLANKSENAALEKLLRGSPLSDNDWALEAELRGVQRLLGSLKSRPAIHEPHAAPASWHLPAAGNQAAHISASPAAVTNQPQPRSNTAAWAILSLGLAVFACGAALLAWSLIGQREDLWPIGMPLALIGQAGLILGLILQLDGLWHSTSKTAAAISELDGELKNVRQATTLLSTSQSGGAQTFYLHLAEGASPQMLLADLKGQMDLLAQQMAKQGK